jgi:glutaredoxin
MAKAFLKSQNIPFEEKDVLTDLAAREDMVKKSGQLGVPVIDVDGKVMVGFDQAELTKLVSEN